MQIDIFAGGLSMSAILNLDQQTMFTINALLLIVFAVAFAFAGLGEKDRTYWLHMVSSNIVLAIAFIIFSQEIKGTVAQVFFPNLLLFLGLSLRWTAILAFFNHPTSLRIVLIPPVAAVFTFILLPVLGNSLVFGIINFLITAQILTIIWTLIVQRESLKSRWGLVVSYAVLVISSFLRALQGLFLDTEMASLLPADIFLHINLIAAAIHISANGAFALLIAYERSVIKLRQIALRDPLTGLLNRWCLETLVNSFTNTKTSKLMTIIMIDIDHFKTINDTHGHSAGDAALKHCAELLEETFQENNLIARVGGEEFMILVPGRSTSECLKMAEKFRTKLATNPSIHKGIPVEFTASIGICTGYVKLRSELNIIWDNADKALYQAKLLGRDRVKIFSETPHLT